jgi:hypothetical protein
LGFATATVAVTAVGAGGGGEGVGGATGEAEVPACDDAAVATVSAGGGADAEGAALGMGAAGGGFAATLGAERGDSVGFVIALRRAPPSTSAPTTPTPPRTIAVRLRPAR